MRTNKSRLISLFCAIFFLSVASAASIRIAAAEDIPEAPTFSVEAGFYDKAQSLELTAPDGCRVYYTTDGSVPVPGEADTRLYENPLLLADVRGGSTVTKGTVIRAVSVTPDGICSNITTRSYFIGARMTGKYFIPVISLVTDPDNLYNKETGIFVHYNERGDEWERPIHFEFFEADGKQEFSINCGTRVHGGASRSSEVKSLRLYARQEYDEQKNFKYDFFSNGLVPALDTTGEPITKFKRLLLRGGGNEAGAWERVYFRDTLTAWLVQDRLDVQASTPCIVFLNGSYYGIMNLRERQDSRYIENHYNLKNEEVAIYEFWYDEQGTFNVAADAKTPELADKAQQEYAAAYQFASTADMSVPENYAQVCEFFDIDNYIDYICIELYSNNTDWPGNNCKAWRYLGKDTGVPGGDGRVRFLLYDTEFGYGLYGKFASYNALANLLDAETTEWPNPKGSTAMFRNLLNSPEFLDAFLTRICDLLNETCEPTAVNAVVDKMAARYAGFIKENKNAGQFYDDYSRNLEIVKDFIKERPDALRKHLLEELDTGEPYTLYVLFDPAMGELKINGRSITGESNSYDTDEGGFCGIYFGNCTLQIEALAKEGYRFTGFAGNAATTDSSLTIRHSDGTIFALEAQFEAIPATKKPEPTATPAADNTAGDTADGSTSDSSTSTEATGNTAPDNTKSPAASADTSGDSKATASGQKTLVFGLLLLASLGCIALLIYQKRK